MTFFKVLSGWGKIPSRSDYTHIQVQVPTLAFMHVHTFFSAVERGELVGLVPAVLLLPARGLRRQRRLRLRRQLQVELWIRFADEVSQSTH
jgi:hypothetical protein